MMLRWLALAALLIAEPLLAQPDIEESKDHYIGDVFRGRIGEVPHMGWFDPDRGFLTLTDSAAVVVYAGKESLASRPKTGKIKRAEVGKGKWIACYVPGEDSLSVFNVGSVEHVARGLYTTKELPGNARSGLITVPLDDTRLATVNQALGWSSSGLLRRDQAFAARPDSFFYSIHRLYAAKTHRLREEAIVLHGRSGQIIASEVQHGLDMVEWCDSCAPPTYEDGTFDFYKPINVFEFASFPYPLVLFDSSTVEGDALSLFTFTPQGHADVFRVYEYVVHCL